MRLLFLAFYLVLVSADNVNNFFSKEFKFDQIEFPTELRQSPFNIRQREGLKKPVERASEALFAVAVRLKSLLDFNTNGDNFLVSPLSVAATLGQLLLGAKGDSRRRITELLSTARRDGAGAAISNIEYHQQFKNLLSMLETSGSGNGTSLFENYELHVASAFFIQPDLRLRPDYKHAVIDFYDCDVVPLNFSGNPMSAQDTVNNWVKINTRGRINTLLSYPLPPTTASIIANAIYFRGAWEYPFDSELTISGTFKINAKERVAVQYMRGQFDIPYAESERLGCQMIILPYKHKQASMHIYLPFDKEYDIRKFAEQIKISDIVEMKLAATERSVTLIMPKMTLTGKFSLKEPLARFKKLQQASVQSSHAPRRPSRPAFVRPRSKRENRDDVIMKPSLIYTLFKDNKYSKRQERGAQSENNSPKDGYNIDEGASGSKSKEQVGNKVTDSKNISHTKPVTQKQSSSVSAPSVKPGDAIETEIITSSIMVPAEPLIVMEVDKMYTVSLNNSQSPLKVNDTGSFPPRMGEFDSDFQISPLLSSFRPGSFSSQKSNIPDPYDRFYRPVAAQPSGYANLRTHPSSSHGSQDGIVFPSEEDTTDKQHTKRTMVPTEFPYYLASHRGSHNKVQQAENIDTRFASSSMDDAAEEDAIQFDLTGASEDSRLRIDDVLHQMWFEVTETGTEAAGASASVVDYSGDVKLVLVDRPFLFVIVHEETSATLFWGTIMDPTGGTGLRTQDPLGRPPSVPSSVVHARGR